MLRYKIYNNGMPPHLSYMSISEFNGYSKKKKSLEQSRARGEMEDPKLFNR